MTFETFTTYEHASQSGALVKTLSSYFAFPHPVTEGWLEDRLRHDTVICWPVENLADAGLRYPLSPRETEPQETYYELEIWLSPDYVYEMSERIDPFPDGVLRCRCGQLLETFPSADEPSHVVGYFAHIKYRCPRCGAAFDTTGLPATVKDPWTGEVATLPGGVTFRFAIVFDCGKCFPRSGRRIAAEPAFVRLLQEVMACSFYQIGDVY
jgi:hypothetical protein